MSHPVREHWSPLARQRVLMGVLSAALGIASCAGRDELAPAQRTDAPSTPRSTTTARPAAQAMPTATPPTRDPARSSAQRTTVAAPASNS